MTQNLIINNDENAENVQFTVEIPDGYNQFKLEAISGTLINQNYLKIGDSLNFEFSNNPIRYDTPNTYKFKINKKTFVTHEEEEEEIDETERFESLALDMFKIYKTLYIPIYSYIDDANNNNYYIFNPCDESQLLESPNNNINDYQLADDVIVPFAGEFIIAMKKVENIPNLKVEFGESIANTRAEFEDLGAINAAGEAIATDLTSTTYTYGSSWRYNVKNLIMTHRINFECLGVTSSESLNIAYFLHVEDENQNVIRYTVNRDNFIAQPFTTTKTTTSGVFDLFSYVSAATYTSLDSTRTYKSNQNLLQESLPIIKETTEGGQTYHSLEFADLSVSFNNPLIDDGFISSGLNIQTNLLKYDYDVETQTLTTSAISGLDTGDNVMYTSRVVNVYMYKPRAIGSNQYTKIKPLTFKLNYGTGTNQDHVIVLNSDINRNIFNFVRCRWTNPGGSTGASTQTFFYSPDLPPNTPLIFTGKFDESLPGPSDTRFGNNSENIKLVYSIYMGKASNTSTYSYISTSGQYPNVPLQLSNGSNYADDDILTHEDGDNLVLTMPTLTNDKITYSAASQTFTRTRNVNLPADVFVPMKSRQELKPFTNDNMQNITPGCCVICSASSLGEPAQELNDDEIVEYLAIGHSSLNVDPVTDDDGKFKTFNGSLLFDRSRSRITRLFASSPSNSCLGYINDILSAKLSRYYFIADWNIFDSFIDTFNQMTISKNEQQNKNIYQKFKSNFYTGEHSVLLCSCYDMVKLIGSETTVNNCQPTITTEEQRFKCDFINFDDLQPFADEDVINQSMHAIKLFHFYNSGFNNYPNITTGMNLFNFEPDFYSSNNNVKILNSMIAITNSTRAKANLNTNEKIEDCKDKIIQSLFYPVNDAPNSGIIHNVPISRVYRNANFEQSDLTISTGRVKTLFPVYIQATSRTTLNNLIYMFDCMLSTLVERYGKINADAGIEHTLDFFNVNVANSGEFAGFGVIRRFGIDYDHNIALSFDSALILNYMTKKSLNDYDGIDSLIESLPIDETTTNTNEELIFNVSNVGVHTLIQLFSKRTFDFHRLVDVFDVVNYSQVLIDSSDFPYSAMFQYFGSIDPLEDTNTKDEAAEEAKNNMTQYIEEFAKNYYIGNTYNIRKTVKCFICKLGEFLEYPRIIFGVASCFNNSNSVLCQISNATTQESAFKYDYLTNTEHFENNQLQKQNVSMFGVMFRYHQLAQGWTRMETDIQEIYDISKARGQKHFILILVDEFGRNIPNDDTSQGFKNDLKLELLCAH